MKHEGKRLKYLQGETTQALRLLALSLPIILTSAALQGVLEAYQKFGAVAAIRIPVTILTYVAPLAVLFWSDNLALLVGSVISGRLIGWSILFLVCLRTIPGILKARTISRRSVPKLMQFGAWITISNSLGLLLVYLDRFVIASMISVAAVTYYTTPYDMVTKLWIVPQALVAVLFPLFATGLTTDHARMELLYGRSVRLLFAAMFPICLIVVAFADELMSVWISAEFAAQSALVLQILCIGVLVNSVARVGASLLQASGNPAAIAKAYFVQIPFYVGLLFWIVSGTGIIGAAALWSARIIADLVLVTVFVHGVLSIRTGLTRLQIALMFAFLLVCWPTIWDAPLNTKLTGVSMVLTCFAGALWLVFLTSEERGHIAGLARRRLALFRSRSENV